MRGRLSAIRRAETGKGRLTLPRAYHLFNQTTQAFQNLRILPYTEQADEIFRQWRSQKIRVGTRDLRIAAICVAHNATLISRNRRDFELIPQLEVTFWQ